MSTTALATVNTTSPLTVLMDLDSVNAIPAATVSSYTPTIGDRVHLQLRTPRAPLIIGSV